MTAKEWGARHVARLIGMSYRTLMHWVTTGLVTPQALVQSSGRRRVRFRLDDIREVRLIAELRRHLSGPTGRSPLSLLSIRATGLDQRRTGQRTHLGRPGCPAPDRS